MSLTQIEQRKCFGVPLQSKELKTIKTDVLQENPDYLNFDGKITYDGFLYLHTCFIQRGRLETVWGVLRAFGYGDDLSLREEFLSPRSVVNHLASYIHRHELMLIDCHFFGGGHW